MRYEILLIVLLTAIATIVVGFGSAAFWGGGVTTNSTSWGIYRYSENISFDYDQHISGKVTPVDGPNNMKLGSYFSSYSNIDINDVRLCEKISASQGTYKTDELTRVRARNDGLVSMDTTKPADSNEYTVTYQENWPVGIVQRKSIAYSGERFNTEEFSGNNLDFAGGNFLYNKDFIKDSTIILSLSRLNATILATDNGIEQANVEATRSTDFRIRVKATGLSDIRYQQSGSKFITGPRSGYEIVNAGEERYYGKYNFTEVIGMKNVGKDVHPEDEWLPCCTGGWDTMPYSSRVGFGNLSNIFDCSCYNIKNKNTNE